MEFIATQDSSGNLTTATACALAMIVPLLTSLVLTPDVTLLVVCANAGCIVAVLNLTREVVRIRSVLICFLAVVSTFGVLSNFSSVTRGTKDAPYVPGGDGEKYFGLGSSIANATTSPAAFWHELTATRINYRGYPMVLGGLFAVFGSKLFVGIVLNYALILFSIVLTAKYVLTLSNARAAQVCALLMCCTPHFISQATILQKDAMLVFAFALFQYCSLQVLRGRNHSGSSYVGIGLSILLIGVTRLPFLIFLPMFVFLTGYFSSSRTLARTGPVLLVVFLCIVGGKELFDGFALGGVSRVADSMERLTDSEGIKAAVDLRSSGVVSRVTAPISGGGVIVRVLMLPVLCGLQYSLPFGIWSAQFWTDHSWYFTTNQLHIIWLLFVGPRILVSLLDARILKESFLLASLSVGVFAYALTAYTFLGVIPRYATPSLVFILPAIAVVHSTVSETADLKVKRTRYLSIYYGLGMLLFILYISR